MSRLSVAAFAVVVVIAAFGAFVNDMVRADAGWEQQQRAKLENQLRHFTPGSDKAFKAQMKLDRLDAWREGRPQAGFPDEFARVLHDMKVPADRQEPEYRTGYQSRELDKARRTPAIADKSINWVSRGPGNVAGRAREILVASGRSDEQHLVRGQRRRRRLEDRRRRRQLAPVDRRDPQPAHLGAGASAFGHERALRRHRRELLQRGRHQRQRRAEVDGLRRDLDATGLDAGRRALQQHLAHPGVAHEPGPGAGFGHGRPLQGRPATTLRTSSVRPTAARRGPWCTPRPAPACPAIRASCS